MVKFSSGKDYLQSSILISYSLNLYFHKNQTNSQHSYYFSIKTASFNPMDNIVAINKMFKYPLARFIVVDFSSIYAKENDFGVLEIKGQFIGYPIVDKKISMSLPHPVTLQESSREKVTEHWSINYLDLSYLILRYPSKIDEMNLPDAIKVELKMLERRTEEVIDSFKNSEKEGDFIIIESSRPVAWFGFEMIYNYFVEYDFQYNYRVSIPPNHQTATHIFYKK